jgi:hypothetical protein
LKLKKWVLLWACVVLLGFLTSESAVDVPLLSQLQSEIEKVTETVREGVVSIYVVSEV